MDLTDAQWAILEPLFRPKRRADGRGRPWRDTRSVLNGVLWILRTGAHNFRRLVSRWEHANFLAMVQLGCLVILAGH